MNIHSIKCLIIKIGSRLLLDEKGTALNLPWMVSLVDDISLLVRQKIKVIIVSSGAVACGSIALNLKRTRLTLDQKQAAAAVGQIQLVHTYQTLFNQQGIQSAQILLTMSDIESRRHYINLRNTMECLLKMGVIPIINENDSVATAEIRYGDNDRLAARVAQMVEADTLVLLSDIDGLYTANPRRDPKAEFISEVPTITAAIEAMAGESTTDHGSGGMITKVLAAKIATNSGCRVLITAGKFLHPLQHFQRTQRGTWFLAQTTELSAKKSWLKEHVQPLGYLTVDTGASRALKAGKSLLPVGVCKVEGRFLKGDPICILDRDGHEVARGLTNYSDVEIQKIMGNVTDHIESLLGYSGFDEVVHRNNLVVTER